MAVCLRGVQRHPCAYLSFPQAMLLLPWGQEINTPQQQPSTELASGYTTPLLSSRDDSEGVFCTGPPATPRTELQAPMDVAS